MKKKLSPKILLIYALLCLLVGVCLQPAFAEIFNLTYALSEGGFRLELSDANPYKGVEITVSSDVSTRYEVIQRLVSPLENREKPGVILRDNFVFRGLRGTNKTGDLRVSVADSALRPDEVLYVSDNAGGADSFTLAYGVTNIEDIEPGHYFGRIAYILNPISSVRQQVTQILDVYVTISEENQGALIEISPAQGGKNILLNPQQDQKQVAEVLVKINGKFRRPFNIMQVLTQPLTSQDGSLLDNNLVLFKVSDAKIGRAVIQLQALSLGMDTIYSSAASGQADPHFVLRYQLGDFSAVKAGKYFSRLQYLLDEQGAQKRIETLDLEIVNPPIFDLQITPLDQKYAIEFYNVKPTEPPRKSEVLIEVVTNTGRQYQVNQEVYSGLTNKKGDVVPEQYFTLRAENVDAQGNLKFTTKEAVKKGSSVLFVSGPQGEPGKFKLIYELECPKDLTSGDYSTKITYSLSEI